MYRSCKGEAVNAIHAQSQKSPVDACLAEMHERFRAVNDGHVADYIPELLKANPEHFGICLVSADGQSYAVGDCDVDFTIQSISKAFVFGLALEDHGRDAVLHKVGVEPSGLAFNAIAFDERGKRPFNPMVNTGAIATAALVKGNGLAERMGRVLEFLGRFTGRSLSVDEEVYLSEKTTGHRNRAIGHLELNFGMIDDRVEEHLDLYFKQCSILVNSRDLAVMAATLANNGINPITGQRAIREEYVKYVVAVMGTCGMYDYSGEWLYRVGLPAKSGVGGGIIAVLPSQLGIGTFSPKLDLNGNSVRGIKVCEELSGHFGLHMFDAPNAVNSAIANTFRGDKVNSKRTRSPAEMAVLAEKGSEIIVYRLRGDLNFAAAEHVVRRAVADGPGARTIMLDAKRVGHLDRPAADLLRRLAVGEEAAGRRLLIIGLHSGAPQRGLLEAAGFGPEAFFADLDSALEWAENELLEAYLERRADDAGLSLADMQIFQGLDKDQLDVVATMTRTVTFPANSVIFPQGGPPDYVYLLMRGQASINVALANGQSLRVSAIGAGVHFGEMALLDGKPRSAELRADTDLICQALDIAQLKSLGKSHPHILTTILTNLAISLSGRLRKANMEVEQLGS